MKMSDLIFTHFPKQMIFTADNCKLTELLVMIVQEQAKRGLDCAGVLEAPPADVAIFQLM